MLQPQALPDIENKVTKLEEEAAILDASGKVLSAFIFHFCDLGPFLLLKIFAGGGC